MFILDNKTVIVSIQFKAQYMQMAKVIFPRRNDIEDIQNDYCGQKKMLLIPDISLFEDEFNNRYLR